MYLYKREDISYAVTKYLHVLRLTVDVHGKVLKAIYLIPRETLNDKWNSTKRVTKIHIALNKPLQNAINIFQELSWFEKGSNTMLSFYRYSLLWGQIHLHPSKAISDLYEQYFMPLLWTVCIVQNSRTFGSFTGLPLDVTAVLRRLSLYRESRGSVEDNYEDKRSTKTVRWRYNTVNFQNFHNRQLIAHQIFMFLNDKLMWYTIQYSGMSDRAIKGFHFICLRGFGDKLYIALYTACLPFIALCGHSCSLLASGCSTHTGSNPVLTKGKRLVYSPFEHVDITSLCHHDCTFIIKQKIPISSYPAVGLSGLNARLS